MRFSKLRGQESNLRPLGYEPNELPLLHPATTNIIFQKTNPLRASNWEEKDSNLRKIN